jgi:hypothetical protein
MALTVSARNRFTGPSAGALIRVAAIFAALGVALSITDDYAEPGKWFAVIGVFLLIFGLHRFGRLGPDATIYFEDAPAPAARKKKRKKKRPREPAREVGSEPEPEAAEPEPEPKKE